MAAQTLQQFLQDMNIVPCQKSDFDRRYRDNFSRYTVIRMYIRMYVGIVCITFKGLLGVATAPKLVI